MGEEVCKGEGLVTRGSVCCLSSSRCSNIFFFVMMPNTILKHTPVTWQTAQDNDSKLNTTETEREQTAAAQNIKEMLHKTMISLQKNKHT